MGSVPLRDKVIFFRQLATMIKAGVTLGNALNILVDQTKNPPLADSIRRVKMAVDGGFSLSGALRTRAEFSTLMVSIVSAGEEGGKLDESLDRLATFWSARTNCGGKSSLPSPTPLWSSSSPSSSCTSWSPWSCPGSPRSSGGSTSPCRP